VEIGTDLFSLFMSRYTPLLLSTGFGVPFQVGICVVFFVQPALLAPFLSYLFAKMPCPFIPEPFFPQLKVSPPVETPFDALPYDFPCFDPLHANFDSEPVTEYVEVPCSREHCLDPSAHDLPSASVLDVFREAAAEPCSLVHCAAPADHDNVCPRPTHHATAFQDGLVIFGVLVGHAQKDPSKIPVVTSGLDVRFHGTYSVTLRSSIIRKYVDKKWVDFADVGLKAPGSFYIGIA
jgi:hypothetical protein